MEARNELASEPMTISEAELSDAFRLIASNVAVITTSGPHGCTGTAWAEDPRSPFVVTPLNRSGTTRQIVVDTGRFAANLLAANQADVARRFAKRGDRFDALAYSLGSLDLPLVDGAAVAIECELESSMEFGTYDLLVGRVHSVKRGPSVGVLTWCDHSFGTHAPMERRRA